MSSVIFGKIIIGSFAAVGAFVIGLFWSGQINKWMDKGIEIYVTKARSSESSDKTLTEGSFQCRLKKNSEDGAPENALLDCLIAKIAFTDAADSKKYFSYDDIALSAIDIAPITTNGLKVDGNVYKITVFGQDANKSQFAKTALEIVATTEVATTAHVVEIQEWFVNDKNTSTFLGKTKYFIGKSGEAITDTSSGGKYKCSFTDASINDENCTIYPFSSDSETDWSKLKFSGSLSSQATKITASKFYIVVFDADQDITMSSEQSQIFVEKKDVATSKSTFTNIHTAVFSKDKFLLLGENK